MKISIFKISSISLLLAVLTSCLADDEEISVKTNDSGQKPVIEAELSTDSLQTYTKLTWLTSIDNDKAPQPIHNGLVTLKDSNTNHTDTLLESSQAPGKYVKSRLKAIEGHTYLLTVSIDNKTYTARSKVGSKFLLSKLRYESLLANDLLGSLGINLGSLGGGIDTTSRYFTCYVTGDSYNSLQNSNYSARMILNFDGKRYYKTLNSEVRTSYVDDGVITTLIPDSVLKNVKVVSVEIQAFDKSIYNYLSEIDNATSNTQAAPTNPPSNISGGALGYFFAHTSSIIETNYVQAQSKAQKAIIGTRKR
jgi:hypothetical protein